MWIILISTILPVFGAGFFLFLLMTIKKQKEHWFSNEHLFSTVSNSVYFIQFISFLYYLLTNWKELAFGIQITIPWLHFMDYHFDLVFLFNYWSIFLSLVISIVFFGLSYLARTYLHAEEENYRFYSLKMLFNFAILCFIQTINIEFMFAMFEIAGLCSVLLIAYFYNRNQAIENSFFVYVIYRFCDFFFLVACLLLFVFFHTEIINGVLPVNHYLFLVGLCLILASLGKSAQFPFTITPLLALEGPISSSTLFYATLSIHMGILLLIKTQNIWSEFLILKILLITIGIITTFIATLAARTCSNIKGIICFSTVSMVGLMYVSLGFKLFNFTTIFLILHILYRQRQFTLSPSVIDEHNRAESHYGTSDIRTGRQYSILPESFQKYLYFKGLNLFNLEQYLKIFGFAVVRVAESLYSFETKILKINKVKK